MEMIFIILLSLIFVWLLIISFLLYRQRKSYQYFTKGDKKLTIIDYLRDLSENQTISQKHISEIDKRLKGVEIESLKFIKKIGLLRFNPFRDTGGDQSFVLSLVDSNDTGVVISALYSRSGTRWYAKKVVKGKGQDYDLSEEEDKSIRLAKLIKNP